MSSTNIQIVQQVYADFSRGDIAAIIDALDVNIEWITPDIDLPTGGTWSGKTRIAEFFRTVGETWDFQAFDPNDYIASGDWVAVRGSYTATSRSTGRKATCDWVMTWKFKDGKITHFQEYTDTAALRDAVTARAAA